MALFDAWCEVKKTKNKRKHLWTFVECDGGRDVVKAELVQTIRSHYDRLERISEDITRLGYSAKN